MQIDLCQPCSTRYIEFNGACERIGERLEMPLLVALLCGVCLATMVAPSPGAGALEHPTTEPGEADPESPAPDGTGFYL